MAIRASTSTVLMGHKFGDAHLVSSLSCIDLLIAAFSHFEDQRMKLILSKGHAACAYYSTIAEFERIPRSELLKFNQDNSPYGIHVSSHLLSEVVLSTGSLGHGLSVGAGISYGAKLDSRDQYSVVIIGDGETNEGSIWEAALIAASLELGNLIAVVDMNAVQSVAEYYEVNGGGLLAKKFESFGWDVIEVDGHSLSDLLDALKSSTKLKTKPTAILADTKKNARVPTMQSGVVWHYRKPSDEDLVMALQELNSHVECPEIIELFK
jgi:transketolase